VPEAVNSEALHILLGKIELESAFESLNLLLDIASVESRYAASQTFKIPSRVHLYKSKLKQFTPVLSGQKAYDFPKKSLKRKKCNYYTQRREKFFCKF